jgi:hypothetical protein
MADGLAYLLAEAVDGVDITRPSGHPNSYNFLNI